MSGGFVPYNLRQNKAIERAVFIDLLQRVARSTQLHIHDYTYVGFAGPFSEDFKLIHSALGISKMISVEGNAHVHKRQKWNSPISCIDYRHIQARAFVDAFQPQGPSIVWLDFTTALDIGPQLDQAVMLLSKLAPYDVFKITLNANDRTLEPAVRPDDDREFVASKIAEARRRLANHLSAGIEVTDEDLDRTGYPKLLLLAIETAVKSGLEGKPGCMFLPLTSFVYADSEQQMLTHTGIILPETADRDEFLSETRIKRWKLATTKWASPRTEAIRINIPEMSVRERLHIDKSLPNNTPSELTRSLGHRLAEGSLDRTRQALASYKLFYRHYPFFSRIVV